MCASAFKINTLNPQEFNELVIRSADKLLHHAGGPIIVSYSVQTIFFDNHTNLLRESFTISRMCDGGLEPHGFVAHQSSSRYHGTLKNTLFRKKKKREELYVCCSGAAKMNSCHILIIQISLELQQLLLARGTEGRYTFYSYKVKTLCLSCIELNSGIGKRSMPFPVSKSRFLISVCTNKQRFFFKIEYIILKKLFKGIYLHTEWTI